MKTKTLIFSLFFVIMLISIPFVFCFNWFEIDCDSLDGWGGDSFGLDTEVYIEGTASINVSKGGGEDNYWGDYDLASFPSLPSYTFTNSFYVNIRDIESTTSPTSIYVQLKHSSGYMWLISIIKSGSGFIFHIAEDLNNWGENGTTIYSLNTWYELDVHYSPTNVTLDVNGFEEVIRVASYPNSKPDELEFGIDDGYNNAINIDSITWVEYEGEDGGGFDGGDIDGDFLANWFIYAVFLLVIPISIIVYVGGNVNPNPMLMLITFLGAETLMSAISLSIGLVDLWFMLVIIIVDVLVILGLMKSGSAN